MDTVKISSLLYHDVIDNNDYNQSGFLGSGPKSYKLDFQEFKSHLLHLHASKEISPITIAELNQDNYINKFMLTFDDGGVSSYSLIKNVLDQLNWKGNFFITGKYINKERFLSTEQILDLDNDGHIIGAHSWSHPSRMSRLSDKLLDYEWRKCIDKLEVILNKPIISASIPGGYFSKRVAKSAIKCGIKFLFTSEPTRKSYFINGCQIIGRYSIQRDFSVSKVGNLVDSFSLEQKRQYMVWNSKKLLKILLGTYYLSLRKLLLK